MNIDCKLNQAFGDRVGNSPYRRDNFSEPYDREDFEPGYPRRSSFSSISRGRHPTFMDTPTMIPDSNIGYGANRFAPGSLPSEDPFGRSNPLSASPGYPSTPYPGSAYTPSTVVISNPSTAHMTAPQMYQLPHSGNGALVPFSRPRSSSFSYPQQYAPQHLQASYSNMPFSSYPPTIPHETVVIRSGKKHRKHRHRHRSRSR